MPYRRFAAVLAACLLTATAARADDRALESYLLDVPSTQGALEDSAHINAEPHYAGSAEDGRMAIWMRDLLRSYGFDATVETVYAQVPQYKHAALQLLVNPPVDFHLAEPPIPQDPDTYRRDGGVPFNAWSGSGVITAPLVYANRGLDADYQTLANAGVDVAGRIVLVRYGVEFRGLLARRAQKNGAAGVIFYSDPADRDGSTNGEAYPDGPYRPLDSAQRGSLDSPPLTIPVLPASAMTGRRLLADIAGVASPRDWHGGLDADYALGATRAQVRMDVYIDYKWTALWNTIGVLPGADRSHEVILGGHRDAWVYGVTDNGSGISTLLEAARALGYLYKTGWRPRYSIAIAGWDGEEIGKVGSGSYVRVHQLALQHGCIAYVNADENAIGGRFRANAAAAIADMVPQIARRVHDPHAPSRTVWETWHGQIDGVRVGAPGGGSDHASFLQLLGVPVIDFGFAGPFGVYHSAYDDLHYATTEADPGFLDHRAIAQMLGLLAFRLSSGPFPYRLRNYVIPMRQAIASYAAASPGLAGSFAPISQAIERYAALARRWDRTPGDVSNGMTAVQRLDLLYYGSDGYTPVAFPELAKAIASGLPDAIQHATGDTAASIDAVNKLIQ